MKPYEEIKAAMIALPQKDTAETSVRATIMRLRPQIEELHFKKGWTWSEIADWLTTQDIAIKENTLKMYYYKKSEKKQKPRVAKSAAQPVDSSASSPQNAPPTASPPALRARSENAGKKPNPVLE
jgi:hypothetical protein